MSFGGAGLSHRSFRSNLLCPLFVHVVEYGGTFSRRRFAESLAEGFGCAGFYILIFSENKKEKEKRKKFGGESNDHPRPQAGLEKEPQPTGQGGR